MEKQPNIFAKDKKTNKIIQLILSPCWINEAPALHWSFRWFLKARFPQGIYTFFFESLWQVSSKGKKPKLDNQIQVDDTEEDHSPVEEVPAEQTRVYQNQPTDQDAGPSSELAVLHKTRPRPKERVTLSPVEPEPDYLDHNWIDEDQEEPTHGPLVNPGFNSNGAIWVNEATEQPGFLFPVTRTTSQPAIRRQMTEEASLSVTPHQVPVGGAGPLCRHSVTVKVKWYFHTFKKKHFECIFYLYKIITLKIYKKFNL